MHDPFGRFAAMKPPDRPGPGNAFLLAQLGAHATYAFAHRMATLGLSPPHAGVLRILGTRSGLSQRALATLLGMFPSRLVLLVDELERMGLVGRRESSKDRRAWQLHLTPAGQEKLKAIGRLAREHDDEISAALGTDERKQLAALLRRIADQQGLRPGVHPGYRRLTVPRRAR